MEAKQIRVNQKTVDEFREIGKEFGETTDDVTIRLIVAEYKRLKVENELLQMKLKECEKSKFPEYSYNLPDIELTPEMVEILKNELKKYEGKKEEEK